MNGLRYWYIITKDLTFKKLFLLDGCGALLTAVLLSQVVANYEHLFGVSRHIVLVLAVVAGCIAIYSFSCRWLLTKNWKPYLTGVALVNSLYSLFTFGLIVNLYPTMTWLGIIYFVGEVLVILSLVMMEFQLIRTKPK